MLIEIHGVADSIVIYLHILQERLTCIRDGFQEGALQTAGKDSCSICTDSQTCYNVVQSNLSDSGLGGHLCGGSWGTRYVGICKAGAIILPHITNVLIYDPNCEHITCVYSAVLA
jgi:hypothetical protein